MRLAGKWQESLKEGRLGAWCRAARPAPFPLLAGNVAGPPRSPRCRPQRLPLLGPWRRFATLTQIIRVNLDAKMAGLHRREGVGAQASSHDWITASKAGIQGVMLRTLSRTPACAGVTIPPEMCLRHSLIYATWY
jgi:hypothetical protein